MVIICWLSYSLGGDGFYSAYLIAFTHKIVVKLGSVMYCTAAWSIVSFIKSLVMATFDPKQLLKDWLQYDNDIEVLEDGSPFMSKAQPNEVGIMSGKLSFDQLRYLTVVAEIKYIESRYDSGESVLIIGL
jgi:hypothetical protein